MGAATSSAPSASGSASPSAEAAGGSGECSDDYDYVALEMVDCYQTKEAVSGVARSGRRTHITVEDGRTACTPGSDRWTCTFAGEAALATIELEAKDPDRDPLAEAAAITSTDPD